MITSRKLNKWLVVPRPEAAAKIRLICLPFAGGSSTSFRPWLQFLPRSIELVVVELPGRGQRLGEPLIHDLDALVHEISDAMSVILDKPFALFGHSMGTLLAYELLFKLQDEHQRSPRHLFVSGRGAPHRPSREDPIHKLPQNEFIEKLKEYNGTPKEVLEHQELMDLMVPIIRADFQVCETYSRPDYRHFTIPVSVFGGLQDAGASREDLEAWAQLTEGACTVRMFPGGHFYFLNSQMNLLQAIVRDLNPYMNEKMPD